MGMGLTTNFWLKGLVAPWGFKAPGTEVAAGFDSRNGLLVSQFSGQYAELVRQNKVFSASAAAITLPVNANNLASVFTLYNPPGSNVNLELIETNVGTVAAATVVDAVGVYSSTAAQTALGTFTTQGTVKNMLLNGGSGQAQFYSAYTCSGTPTLARIIGGWGATSDTATNTVTKAFNGSLLVPPGTSIHVAMSTAASTSSGITLDTTWAEIPLS
jgi:hypothetical protein